MDDGHGATAEMPPRAMLTLPSSIRSVSLLQAAAWSVALSIFFFLIYGACNTFTHYRDAHWHDVGTCYANWEMHIPFVPAMIVPYMSIDVFFVLAPFVCATSWELHPTLVA